MKVARPTQKPSNSFTGESSMVAIKPPVPIVDLYIMSSIALWGYGKICFAAVVNIASKVTQVLAVCGPGGNLVFSKR